MALSRSSLHRARVERKYCLILDQAFRWVQIRRIGWQIKHGGSSRRNQLRDTVDLVRAEIVHHHHIAWLQRGHRICST